MGLGEHGVELGAIVVLDLDEADIAVLGRTRAQAVGRDDELDLDAVLAERVAELLAEQLRHLLEVAGAGHPAGEDDAQLLVHRARLEAESLQLHRHAFVDRGHQLPDLRRREPLARDLLDLDLRPQVVHQHAAGALVGGQARQVHVAAGRPGDRVAKREHRHLVHAEEQPRRAVRVVQLAPRDVAHEGQLRDAAGQQRVPVPALVAGRPQILRHAARRSLFISAMRSCG